MSPNDEFEPYVLCRVEGGQLECALWSMPEGKSALALFRSDENAMTYRHALNLPDLWKVYRPSKVDLVQILKAGHESGVKHAVLDPDLESAKYVFVLKDVLVELGALEP